MHICFYDRGVDAKLTPVRDPVTLCDLDDLPMPLLDYLRPARAHNLQDRLRVGYVPSIDTRKCPIDQVGPNFVLQVVVAPVEHVHQHPDNDFGRRAQTTAALALRPPPFQRLSDNLNHGFVLERGVDSSQPVGPQFVASGNRTSNRLRSRCRR
jgi:hypothetical protein